MHSHVANHPRLGKLLACFSGPENQPSPGDEEPPNPSLLAVPNPYDDNNDNNEEEKEKAQYSPKSLAESYIPSWHRDSSPATGRRKATSISTGSNTSSSISRPRSASHCSSSNNNSNNRLSDNGMLYFGEDGHDPHLHQAAAATTGKGTTGRHRRGLSLGSAPPARAGGGGGGRPGFASGRDASGNVSQRINDNSPMAGMYSNLTYGGSLQLNPGGVLGAAGLP